MIDYVIGDTNLKVSIERLVIEDKMDSDHHSVVIWVKENEEGKGRYGREIGGKEAKIRWLVEGGGARRRDEGNGGGKREGSGAGVGRDERKNRKDFQGE